MYVKTRQTFPERRTKSKRLMKWRSAAEVAVSLSGSKIEKAKFSDVRTSVKRNEGVSAADIRNMVACILRRRHVGSAGRSGPSKPKIHKKHIIHYLNFHFLLYNYNDLSQTINSLNFDWSERNVYG